MMADLIEHSRFDEYNGTVPEGMDVGRGTYLARVFYGYWKQMDFVKLYKNAK